MKMHFGKISEYYKEIKILCYTADVQSGKAGLRQCAGMRNLPNNQRESRYGHTAFPWLIESE